MRVDTRRVALRPDLTVREAQTVAAVAERYGLSWDMTAAHIDLTGDVGTIQAMAAAMVAQGMTPALGDA
jgi:hypothetical protein